VGGFFTQIGDLYVVHHLWGMKRPFSSPFDHCILKSGNTFKSLKIFNVFLAYKDLQSREQTRNAAWLKEGWDVNVHYTSEYEQRRGMFGIKY